MAIDTLGQPVSARSFCTPSSIAVWVVAGNWAIARRANSSRTRRRLLMAAYCMGRMGSMGSMGGMDSGMLASMNWVLPALLLWAQASSPALDTLVQQADRELKTGPLSVMHKKLTPSSGDKHDYMSVGPYWWPDPSKPDGLPYIRRDGVINPDRNNAATDSEELHKMFGSVAT